MDPSPQAEPLSATDLHVEATYRLTEALVEAENRMLRRVELLSEVVFETDRSGILVFLNNAWTATTGYPTAACLGQRLCEFVIEEDASYCAGIMTQAQAEDGACIRLRHAEGGIISMEISVTRTSGGGVVGALHNVTCRKQVEDELAKLSLVASYTDNLVIITDRDGLTEWVNQAFINRTGYTLADMLGRKPGAVLQGPDTDPATVALISQQFKQGCSYAAELLNYTRRGEAYWIAMQITPIRGAGGRIERYISVQTDVTEMRKTGLELEAAKLRAEAANEAKTQFLATISHEMRTPLNAILGSVELALEANVDSSVRHSHLRRIDENADILLRLISDMLDMSKIEAGQFDLEHIPVPLRDCLEGALVPLAERAGAKGLDFQMRFDESLPPLMMGDPDRLRQIVTNLVENAIKFTDRGSLKVEVSRLESRGGGSGLEIRVIDTGVGIPPEAQSRIFLRFERADISTTRRKGGAGLGLSIVKSLVEALGGQVSVQSQSGEGAEFRVVLPLVAAPEAASPEGAEAGREPRECEVGVSGEGVPSRILVAEDTNANFAIVAIFLQKAGYEVTRAIDGRDTVAAASDVDLILMDIEMPDMDGLEATRLIRRAELEDGRVPVPILVLTAHAIQGYRERCLAAGCTGYLTKPIRREGLIEAVAAALRGDRPLRKTGSI